MAKVLNQDIPSENAFSYSSSLRPAVDHPGLGRKYGTFKYGEAKYGATFQSVQRRYPFKQPYKQNSSPHSPTAAQRATRDIFIKCKNCFNSQPKSGGVTPPTLGPRNREYWYTSSGGSGLFYYDYFMQQTLSTWFGAGSPDKHPFTEDVPDWCQTLDVADSWVNERFPNNNYGSDNGLNALYAEDPILGTWSFRFFIKFDLTGYTAIKFNAFCRFPPVVDKPIYLRAYNILEDWNENNIIWDNQPSYGSEIGSILLHSTGFPAVVYEDWVFLISGAGEFGAVFIIDEFDFPTNGSVRFSPRSREFVDSAKRPLAIFQ